MTNNLTHRDQNLTAPAAGKTTTSPTAAERTITPRASVFETTDSVVLELEMPGVQRDSIDVSVENDELTVSGRRVFDTGADHEFLHQERLPFNYKRSFVLSERIDTGRISAKYNDGVLRLDLPKSAEAKPRKITID